MITNNISMLNPTKHTAGLSLIELMVALAISSLLMLGLVASFKSSSDSQKALEKAGILIENGRYAVNLIADDLRIAGYFGYYADESNPPTSLQDPCSTSTATLLTAVKMPIQGYPSSTLPTALSGTACASLLTSNNLKSGSDVLVVRRADTQMFSGTPVDGQIYVQANSDTINVLEGDSGAGTVNATSSNTVDGNAQALKKYPKVATSDWADIRKYHVDVYFVSPCAIGTGTNGVCQAGDARMPTLKRLELTASSGSTSMEIVPLVEGIEFMKVEYGIDTTPSTVDALTKLSGDSIPDTYVTAPTAAQWPYVVAARVYLLARATETTQGYTDSKSYTLGVVSGGTTIAAASDSYTRHVFSAEVRPMNLAGRREIP